MTNPNDQSVIDYKVTQEDVDSFREWTGEKPVDDAEVKQWMVDSGYFDDDGEGIL